VRTETPLKLSELNPAEVKIVEAGQPASGGPLKLSSLKAEDVKVIQAERGKQVYEEPQGPEQAGAFDRFKERVTDPQRWAAVLKGEGPYAQKSVQGTAPLMMPGGAIPKLTRAASALSEGTSIAHALGRTALSTGQGAVMSALDSQEGESWQDKIDRAKEGGELSGKIQLAVEAIPVVGKTLGYAGRKIGAAISGVDENILSNYAKRTDEVNDIIKQSGGDITAAADQVRTELSEGIQRTKRALNSQISKTLESAAPEASISVDRILKSLKAAKEKLNPNFKAGAIADLDDMIRSIESEAQGGLVNVSSLYQIKQFLRENSKGAYNKGGQIFSRASEASRAAKDAAFQASDMLKPVAGAISKADQQLSKLHSIEARLNRNLLAPGKPDGALLAAGSGANARNAATLRELEKISGVPVAQRAQDLATAKAFASPSLMPTDFTGKAAARILLPAGVGYAAGDKEGAAVAAGLASPMAMKLGINLASIPKGVVAHLGLPKFADFIRKNPLAAQTVVQLVAGQIRRENRPEITPEVQEYFRDNPKLLQDVQDPKVRARIQQAGRAPAAKGESKWAQDGAKKLGLSPDLAAKALQSKQAKRLLIEASDLPAGSKRLQAIKNQLSKEIGESHGRKPSSTLR
jgi:hypothetical protein